MLGPTVVINSDIIIYRVIRCNQRERVHRVSMYFWEIYFPESQRLGCSIVAALSVIGFRLKREFKFARHIRRDSATLHIVKAIGVADRSNSYDRIAPTAPFGKESSIVAYVEN